MQVNSVVEFKIKKKRCDIMLTTIFKNGTAMSIKIPKNISDQETYASTQLLFYLERMTCHVFEMGEEVSAPFICIGSACDEYGITFDGSIDGFVMKTIDGNIFINGGKRGIIYGCYELVEKLGCRFFTSSCEKVPLSSVLELPELDEVQEPDFSYREHNYSDLATHSLFSVKSRFNGKAHDIAEKFGGHHDYSWFVHSFEHIISPEEFAESHPEYFAMNEKGVRDATPFKNQLCLSNPDLVAIATEKVRQNLLENPQATIVSISQNDWILACQCDQCKKAYALDGDSPAGLQIQFVNAIAENLEAEFPHVLFDTLAYQYTRNAPTITRPRHNVCVRLCSIECCFAHSFEECDDTSRGNFVKDLKDWHAAGAKMYIWDYTTCFNYYPTPHPNWRSLQPNAKLFKDNGVIGVFEQANGAKKGGTDLNELRAYVISKLLWNVNADVKAIIKDFTSYYYKDAGVYIEEYINALCDASEKENSHVGFNDLPLHAFLSDEYLEKYEDIFQKALKAVAGDGVSLARVEKAYLSIRYVRMMQKFLTKKEVPAQELNSFYTDWYNHGLSRIEEWTSNQTSHKAYLRGLPKGANFYLHIFWGLEGAEVL